MNIPKSLKHITNMLHTQRDLVNSFSAEWFNMNCKASSYNWYYSTLEVCFLEIQSVLPNIPDFEPVIMRNELWTFVSWCSSSIFETLSLTPTQSCLGVPVPILSVKRRKQICLPFSHIRLRGNSDKYCFWKFGMYRMIHRKLNIYHCKDCAKVGLPLIRLTTYYTLHLARISHRGVWKIYWNKFNPWLTRALL